MFIIQTRTISANNLIIYIYPWFFFLLGVDISPAYIIYQ